MKNLLNNLLNWVLKKGSSETKKDQAWEEKDQVKGTKLREKEQAGSKKDQVKGTKLSEKEQAGSKKEQVKRTKLEMNPCGMGSEAREVMGSEVMSVKGSEAVSANHALITQLSRTNHPISLRAIRYAAVLFMVLMVGVGNVWGANGDVLFNQGFGSATAVAYSANTARSYSTSSTLSGLVGTGDNLFQGAQCNNKTNCGIAINTTSGANSYSTAGTFQAYANNTSFKWALYKTTNFAATAPTAIKFEMDVTPKYIDNKQALAVVVGSGFSVGTSKPGWTAGYTGFNIITNSTKTGKIYIGKVGGTTSIQETTGMTSGTNYHITWVINATGDDLTYTGPDSKSYTLATAKWDMWVGTTRIISGQDRTKTGGNDFSGTTMQNLYIGNDVSGKHEVIIDNVKVTDLTPDPCEAADLTASNITSNGNQEAGTGITFSKVGSPASGDTWYWQTSATGTDKSSNATSPYTTATTAGSYTVYLRAYNTAGNCWGTAASMTNTIYPAPSAMIHNTFAVNDAWSSTIATQDKTNITGLNAMAAVGETVGSGSNKSGLTQKIPSQSSEEAGKYMSLSFNVASGKQLNVTSVVFDEQPVNSTGTFKVSISDNQGSATKTQTIASGAAGSKHTLTLDGDIVGSFKGTVTVKVWAYGWGDGYRFGDYFYIHGTVTDATACTAPTAVYVTQTAGSSDMVAGESFTLSAATSTGVEEGATYQWYKNSTEVGTNSQTFTVPSCTKVDAGTYWCKITNPCSADAHTTNVTGFGIKVWQVLLYESSTWNSYDLTSTGTKTGRMSRQLAPGTYYIKLTHNNGVDFGVNTGSTISEITATTPSPWTLYGSQNNIKLTVTTAGEYTFDVNYTSADYPTLSVTYPPSTISSCDKIYFCPTQNSIATGSAKFSIYFFNATTNAWANCYLVSGTEYADDAKYVAYAPATTNGWTGMIVVRYSSYISNWDNKWNQSEDITYNGYNYIVGRNEWTSDKPEKFKTHLNSFYSSTTPAMSAASYATTVGETTNASTNLTGATITYASDNTSIATVNSSGVITGVAAGETTITASVGSCTVGSATVTISKNTPTAYTVSGTTTICSGSTATITLSGSEDGASYQLKKGGVAEGVAKAGTGSSLTWTVSAAGTYTVSAVETAKYLGGDMTGNAVITVKTPVTISWNNAPANGTVGGSMTASVTTNYSDGVAYSVQSATPAGCVTINSSTGAISYVAVGTATIRATVTGAGNYCSSAYVDQAITVTAAAVLTALECNTRYTVQDMTAGGCGTLSGTSCYSAGLSANSRFEVLGDPSKTSGDGGTPEQKTNTAQTIGGKSFSSFMYLKGDGLNGASEPANPTCRGVKFIVPSDGKLTIYYRYGDRSKLKKEGQTGVNVGTTTGGYGYDTHNVTAGTYYIYGVSGGAVLIAVEYQCCTTPAAPTAFANTAVTSTTATFSITDGADAASYDLYYASGSPSTPTDGTAATENVTTKTPTITGLTASTTYKIWVRAVCDASHKSAWVALGTTSFTTSAAEPTALVTWQMKVDQAAWALKSGTTEDGTNITSIASTANEPGSTSTGITGTTGKVVMASGESNVDKAASFTFTVNSAKKVVPEKVTCKVLNVSSGDRTYKAQLSDNNGHVYYSTNTVSVTTENVLTDATFNFASSLVLTGNVTLKVYAWKTSGSPTQFRMGEYVKLFGEVQNAADYTVTHTMSNVTKSAGATSVKEGNNYTATYAGEGGNALPSTITVTIGGDTKTVDTDYTWNQGTGVVTIPGNKVTGNIVITVTGVAPAPTYSVTHSLTNVTATSGATGAGAATEGVAYDAVFSANTGYVLPSTITVTIDGSPATVGTGYTWNASTGAFQVPAEQVTGAIVITIAGETAPATKDIYYGQVAIADGALVREITNGTIQFFTNIGGTVANNTEISLSSTPSTGGIYYNSNNLTDAELSKSSNWGTSSGSNRYVRGLKFANGATYTLALGAKVASTITFYGWCGSSSKTMTVGDEEFTSSSTKNTFAKHVFSKSGGFTGNVSITEDGDFYGIIVVTIQTADACTTPVIPTLSNQTVCPGSDIAAWNATQTAELADGETASYSWKKKGNDTEIEDEATLDLGAATESMAGTYVVTVTVSKAGKASATATKEVTLTVTAAVEEPVITANKATVYPGNSVTLTATCGTDGVTWNWYSCANADGTGAGSSLGTSSSYTIASAGATGTYYYKAVATGSCGTAERVYTLTVTAASECEKYFWFVYAADATTNGVVNNRDGFFTGAPTGSSNSSTYKFTLDGTEYTATKNTGSGSFSISFTIPEGSTATMGINCKGSSSKPLYLTHSSGTPQKLVSNTSSNASCTVEDITEGTWTLTSAGSWTLAALGVQVCTTSSCTDATPTITAVNNTVCSGTKMRIDATGYEAGATFKWQKLNTSTSSWDDVAGATLDSLVIASVTASNAGSYRFIATKGCARTSNTVTISVPTLPDFGSTVPASVSVMQTIALSINTVEATDAVKYKWYKSADDTWDAGDTEIGTNKELIKAYDGEAIGSPSYYIFCRAQNACGITTSDPIAVNVTAYVEEDCATRGNESDAAFSFENSGAGQGSYQSANCYTMNSNGKILVYSAPDGKYFKTAKVTIASSSESKASYNWSTNGGTSYTAVSLTVNSTLTERTINLSAHGNVNAFQIGRNFDSKGSSGGTLYVSKICFEYTDACTATTVTPSGTGSETHTIGSDFTEPNFTLAPVAVASETLTYSSSNEDIATVDDDGTVTFQDRAGTVVITAAYAGGEVSSTQYCASEGSYTITVSCSDEAPKIVPGGTVNMSGCNSSVVLNAKRQDGTSDFSPAGTYQWFRNGEEIDGATSSSYTATQAGTYTVERTNTSDCTTPSTNSAVVTSETTEPEVERLVPFQYYHVNKTYSDQMKMRHLFAVKNSGKLDGKSFKMYVSRNGAAATDVTGSNALVVWPSGDGHVDTVMVDLNKLSGKYTEGDELVFTCKAIDCTPAVSDVYKNTITMRVIGATPTLALICSGSSKAEGTRKTSELTVGGDFLTGYNVADLCQQTGNTSFNANIEWGLYTNLKTQYIVTPVNGYAVFNRLNYEPFDILLLTDYPKASKSDAAADVLDDMAALCDYRPMLSFKTHMVAKSPSKWAAKGFTTAPVVPKKTDGRLNLNIVCYAHPMFKSIKTGADVYKDVANTSAPLVYTMLTGEGYEGKKGMQGFEIAAAENFVTIGLIHDTAFIDFNEPITGQATWTTNPKDRMLVTVAERQTNIEARFILFSLNCGAQSKLTDKGEQVILACLEYLLDDDPLHVADCSFTFDNGEGNMRTPEEQAINCPSCPPAGDHKWNNPANWGPDYRLLPGEFTSVRIKKPVEVNDEHAHVMEVRIIDEGRIDIPAGKALDVKSTIRRMDGSEIYPTEIGDIHIGSGVSGNGTLIFNNNDGDTKARVDMYSNAPADVEHMSAATSTWQYIGTPHSDVANARSNYYGSWLYQYSGSGWEVIPNGGPLVPFRGYCVTHPDAPVVFDMAGTLVATTAQDITIPAGYTVIANSWVAPIDISTFTDDDMENISDKTIYFFNTGTDADGNHGTGTEAGTYVAVPKNSASYVGTWQIPSMQGFYISTTSAGTLHLDYDRHVRPTVSRSVVSNPMYAPRRAAAESDEPAVLKIFASGSRYQDKLVVLEREDFTRGYDSGWDGEAWGGGTLSPMVYVTGEGREDAVSAIPEFEGTVIAFKAGEDEAYTLHFEYLNSDEPLYLFDTENNTYTQIMTGNAYYFTTSDKSPHSRFILTRQAPQTPTDIGNGEASGGARAKKFILNDKMYIMINGLLYDATGKVVK